VNRYSFFGCNDILRRVGTAATGRFGDRILVAALCGLSLWFSYGSANAQLFTATKVSPADGAAFDHFGLAVDISGMTAVVGSPRDDDHGTNSGSAYVYEFDGTNWVQTAKLTASDGSTADAFGSSVSISGNVIVVGAPFSSRNASGSGSVYLFEMPVSGWVDMTETALLDPSDFASQDVFGTSVSIDGDTVVAGAPQGIGVGSGKAYIFEKPIDGWVSMQETAILTATSGSVGDDFGKSVAIRGTVVVIGVPGSDAIVQDAGIAMVYQRPIDGWVSATEDAVLRGSDMSAGDGFGSSVDTSESGIVVGAPFHDAGISDAGAAYVFLANQNGWTSGTEVGKLLSTNASSRDEFGNAVAMESGLILVGSHKNDTERLDGGAAFIFDRPKSGWTDMFESDVVLASDASNSDGFGTGVAVDQFMAVIGSPFDDDFGDDSGSMYLVDVTPDCLDLQVFNLIAGSTATFSLQSGTPGQKFTVLYGLGGPPTIFNDLKGYCATFGFGFINRNNVLGTGQFDANGDGSVDHFIDPNDIGFTWKIQAAERGTCPDECVSNIVKEEVR